MLCSIYGVVSLNSFESDAFPLSLKFDKADVLNRQDPPMPPSLPEVEAYASNESSMSDYCRFGHAVLYLPSIEGVDVDFDIQIEQDGNDQSDGPCTRFVLYTDNMLWCQLVIMKDLQPELLRWYLHLKEYNFVVRNKDDVHTLIDPNRA